MSEPDLPNLSKNASSEATRVTDGSGSTARPGHETPVLEASDVSKTFVGKRVLHDARLTLYGGEIHCLLGENGSGKSTLIKILSGYHEPDPGASVVVRGEPITFPLPVGGLRTFGVAFVHQDLALIESGTVVENLRIGRYKTGLGWHINWSRERDWTTTSLESFGLSLDPRAPLASVSEVDRALVAIVRALDQLAAGPTPGVLVLDEPTAYLPRDGVDRLFRAIRTAAARGFAVLFVTHNLAEVQAVADRVSVLRNGRLVHTGPAAGLSEAQLVEHILGGALAKSMGEPPTRKGLEVRLRAERVTTREIAGFDVTVHSGEVVGVTGLLGSGWEHVPYALFGALPGCQGRLATPRGSFELSDFTPGKATASGLALVPANRLRDGAAPLATISENMTLAVLSRYFRGGWLRQRSEVNDVERLMADLDIRPPEPHRIFSTLSGGNQQKAIIAKWLTTNPALLLMHEPTHGVDVGAKRQILNLIRSAANDGAAFLLASSEYDDLAELANRVIIFRDGRPVEELNGNGLTADQIAERALSTEPSAPGPHHVPRD